MLKVCDGCKDGLDTDKDGSYPLPQKGAALAPFHANRAHPSIDDCFISVLHVGLTCARSCLTGFTLVWRSL